LGEEMISELKYRWRLSRLFADLEKMRRVYSKHLKEAMAPGMKKGDYLSVKAEAQHMESLIQEDIDIHFSSYLLRKARRLFVPIPPHDREGMWRKLDLTERWVLTEKGAVEVRAAIRTEQKEGSERFILLCSVVTGIIGSLTGLLAVFWVK
jgi:hypothetical protein